MPSPTTRHKSPYQLLFHKKPNYSHLRVFGCACYPLFPNTARNKLEPRTTRCIFLGYPPNSKGYKCLHPSTGRIYITRNIVFDENTFPLRAPSTTPASAPSPSPTVPASPLLLPPSTVHNPTVPSYKPSPPLRFPQPAYLPSTEITITDQSLNSSPIPSCPSTETNLHPHHVISTSNHPMITRAKSGSLKPKTIFDLLHIPTNHCTPTSLSQAIKSEPWREAMSQEFSALQQQGTWILVPPPSNRTILGSRWTYRPKLHADGTIARHKARLVAQGHKQQYGLDYQETFSPVAKLPTICILLTIALHHSWPIHQFDVSNAFLHGALHDTVYMHQPPGFKDTQFPDHVCLLKKSIYGLKQAPRQWFTTFSTHLLQLGFKFSAADPSLLTYHTATDHLYLLIYVDDILFTGSSSKLISSIISNLQTHFQIKILGHINQFLGINTISTPQGFLLSQSHYAEAILHKAGLSSCKPVHNPFPPKQTTPPDIPSTPQDPLLYRHLVGALQYLTITRPDIQFATNTLCQSLHNPSPTNFALLKRLLRYIRGTTDLALPIQTGSPLHLRSYSDANWASDTADRRSTTGFCSYLGSTLISWQVKK